MVPHLGPVSAPEAGAPGRDEVAPDEVRAALAAVLGSEGFAMAPRSREFLAYVVAEQLAGRGHRLGEHAVARHALGRPAYDGRVESSVRVQATRLRGALARYYDGEGASATVRISLPPGSYVPAFARVRPDGSGLPSGSASIDTAAAEVTGRRTRW